jgi:hypothetical protein
MIRSILLAAVSLLAASCATQLPQAPPSGVGAEVSAPQPKAGSFWRYAVVDGFTRIPRDTVEYRVAGIDADVVTVNVSTNRQQSTELYSRDGNWLRRPATNLQEFTFSPAYRAFDFPLTAGKRWNARATATDPADGRSFPVRIEARVLGWEKIRVPAGEFDALKVRRHVFVDYWVQGDRGQSVIMETDWYAPALQQIVRREATSQYLKLAGLTTPRFVLVDDDPDGDDKLPRYEQDEWLIYELIAHGAK